ncbi:MAG: SUMF1/EgtB/PvdO family nonheme iron enzyme [Acidiferrobacterales bacterium]
MLANPVKQLDNSYQDILELAATVPADQWHLQFHPDLSPVGWHVGHCVFIESYWLQHMLGSKPETENDLQNLYFPWLSPKHERAKKIPELKNLINIAQDDHKHNLDLLNNLIEKNKDHALLNNNYLPEFLVQHYCQHIETLQQIILYTTLKRDWSKHECTFSIEPTEPRLPAISFSSAKTMAGCPENTFSYDNEIPRHENNIAAFSISRQAVTNSEYLGFMESGGYQDKNYWDREGLDWLQKTKNDAPIHWRKQLNNEWYCLEYGKPENLKPDTAVYGINHFEARAFTRYAGCRLPAEIEWEHAVTHNGGYDLEIGQAWEWCQNYFYPYPGFTAFPYENYSKPWFDNQHYTLRGGSIYTDARIKRPSFRNFYTPEKRHIFAGLRLAISQ